MLRLKKTEFSLTLTELKKKVKVGGDLWRSSGPILLLKLGHQEMIAQEASENLQEWRMHKLCGQTVQVIDQLPSQSKLFPDVQRESPVFLFLPVDSGPVTGHH